MAAESAHLAGSLKVSIDRNACCGYGACKEICPEVYQLEGGLVVLTMDVVPPELAEKATDGADSCPQAAIVVEPIGG